MSKEKPKTTWQQEAIGFMIIVYIINVIILPLIQDKAIDLNRFLMNIPFAVMGGLGYGLFMRYYRKRQEKD